MTSHSADGEVSDQNSVTADWQGENQQVTKQHANVASRIHLK